VGPALVALLVALAATAGTFGYLVTRRVVNAEGSGTPTSTGTVTSGPPRTTPARTGQPTSSGTATTDAPDPGDACPSVTADALRSAGLNSELRLLLYIHTHKANVIDSEVWVCANADDRLVYQGHRMDGPMSSADNGRNTLLLAEGIKGTVEREGTGYKATNPSGDRTTEYHVSREVLVIVHKPGGNEERHPVVEAKP
jgi:hypothetical protein